MASAIESAYTPRPSIRRDQIPINATVPAIAVDQVPEVLARFPGARTAKVKVAEPGQSLADDVARVNAVRARVPTVRVDANGGWSLDEAVVAAGALTADGPLEYLEQPCATVAELAELRRRVEVPIAADESIRKADDPFHVVRAGAADIAVLKVAPLGGIAALLYVAAFIDVPVVVSSALDSAVGIAAGLTAAAALPNLQHACGLGTGGLFVEDVAEPVAPVDGYLPVKPVTPDPARLDGAGGLAGAPAMVDRPRQGLPPAAVLICGGQGLDAITGVANTEFMRSVLVLGFPGIQALDLVGPSEVFAGATLYLASQGRVDEGYAVTVVSRNGEPATTGAGLALVAQPLPDPREPVDTLVLPGGGGVDAVRHNPDTIGWIQIAAERARRVVSVCTGAFIAAQAGLLDGCVATTHWAFAGQMASEFPSITVDPDPIFVRSSDQVWTAAGVTAGIDLALSLVEDDYGTDVAQTVARWMVLYLRRPGGQTQFAAPVWMPRAKRAPIRDVQEAIESEPGGAHSIPELARRAAMSPRHFTRLFTDEVGEAPGAYVERIRTEAARRQLEETDDTVTVIAARCGFGSAETLRRNFVRRLGVSPDQYRKTFA